MNFCQKPMNIYDLDGRQQFGKLQFPRTRFIYVYNYNKIVIKCKITYLTVTLRKKNTINFKMELYQPYNNKLYSII